MRVAQLFACLSALVLGVAHAAPAVITPQDLGDFAAVIPFDRVWGVVSDYLAYDKDVRGLLGFLHTDDFKALITKVDQMPEFIEFMNGLVESGYKAHKYWSIIHTALGLPMVEGINMEAPPQLSGGVDGLVSDVRALLQEDSIKRVYEQKLKTNPRFQMLVDHFQGQKFKNVIVKVAELPEVATLMAQIGDLTISKVGV